MATHRYHLPTEQLKRIARVEQRELDAITRRRHNRHDQQAATRAVERQTLRAALWPSPPTS